MRIRRTITAVLAALICVLPVAAQSVQTPAREPLTVMSFNIRYGTANDGDNHWNLRREFLFDVMRETDADLAGLREFQRGDPPQRVAWKAVARGMGWFSKEFDGAGGGGPLALRWDALPQALPVEARLSRLTAWVLAAERSARPFSLALPGTYLPARQGRDHRREALTALAEFPAESRA